MKKILFLVFAVLFSISVSAHEDTTTFNHSYKTSMMQHTASHTTMYTMNNGGLMQLIYNVFHKVGQVFYSTTVATDSNNETTTSGQ
jgi:hypothetical protein